MELIYFNDFIEKYSDMPLSCCIGEFDGIHLAHQQLIQKTVDFSLKNNTKSAMIFFEPHPYLVFNSNCSDYILTDLYCKEKISYSCNIDFLLVIPFDIDVSKLSPEDFINSYLLKLNIKKLYIGFDFRFGFKAMGSVDDIRKLTSIDTEVVEQIDYKNNKLSSTLVRKYLHEGNVTDANNALGHDFFIHGEVVHGFGRGHELGFPTANIQTADIILKPKNGVYIVDIEIDGIIYHGICNVGNNPTFNGDKKTIEVYIDNFNDDIYGKKVSVYFKKYLRDDSKFNSKEELVNQLKKDLINLKNFFN